MLISQQVLQKRNLHCCSVADDRCYRPEEKVSTRPGECRRLVYLGVIFEEKESQAFFYMRYLSDPHTLTVLTLVFAKTILGYDFETGFCRVVFRFVFDLRSPPSALSSPLALGFSWRCSSFFGHPMLMQVIQGL